MRLLITGGSGFIGTNAVDICLARGIETASFDLRAPRDPRHRCLWRQVDLCDGSALAQAMVEYAPTHVLHLGAATGMDVSDPCLFDANVVGITNLIEAARRTSIQHVLFTSSLLVCRNGYIPSSDTDYCPPNLYGESKVQGERIVRSSPDLPFVWTIVRPTSIWGPWFEHSYHAFFKAVARGLYVHPGRALIVKPISFVGNTVHMMLSVFAAQKDQVNRRTLYLADYPPRSVRDWANAIQRAVGSRPILTAPLPLLRLAALGGDVLRMMGSRDPPLSSFRVRNMLTGGHYPTEPIQALAGTLPYSLEDGVGETVAWLRRRGDI